MWKCVCLLIALGVTGCGGRRAPVPSPSAPAVEIRGLWVDGFHAGIRTPAEAEELVDAARRTRINALFVQVRRRGDAYYTQAPEPAVEEPAYDPKFDALEHVIRLARPHGIEVHAWINATPLWRNQPPPKDPRHLFHRHGLTREGEDNWLTYSSSGSALFPVGYFLDPGHPAAAAFLGDVYLNIVRNYEVDGIHFDYIRYPETEQRLPRGADVGYNPTSLARFKRETGRQDIPLPGDEQWMSWRRRQVTQLVRRIYIESKAIRPNIRISAATIAWGKPPTSENDFLDAAPGQRIFQDWHAWLKEGILDLAMPMNYARENDPQVRGWFDGWIRWEKEHKHGRYLAVGVGAYLNLQDANLAQVGRARAGERRSRADGVVIYSYANPSAANPAGNASGPSGSPRNPCERLAYLSEGDKAPFREAARFPPMDWVERPSRGWISGTVMDAGGRPLDAAAVSLKRSGFWPFRRTQQTVSDGNGFFGFAELKPGRYLLRVTGGHASEEIEVSPGKVARIRLQTNYGVR